MSDFGRRMAPTWYWIVSALALMWCLIGCYIYIIHMTAGPDVIATWPESQQKLWALEPAWHKGVFAIAVWTALAGAIGLLLRKSWAVPWFFVSLVAVLIQFGYTFFGLPTLDLMPASQALPVPLTVIILAFAMLWLARTARAKGWIS